LIIVIAAVMVLLTAAAVSSWRFLAGQRVQAENTVSLAGGRVTFQAPEEWRRVPCPADPVGCVDILPPAPADGVRPRISVAVTAPDTEAPGGPFLRLLLEPDVNDPEVKIFTVDGVRVARVRADAGSSPYADGSSTFAVAVLPDHAQLTIFCDDGAQPELVGVACELVIDSLRIRG
jgi:hypothetical protein